MKLNKNDYITIAGARNSLYLIVQKISGPSKADYANQWVSIYNNDAEDYYEVQAVDYFKDYDQLSSEWPHSELIDCGDDVLKLEF